jgi:hypothetical protein
LDLLVTRVHVGSVDVDDLATRHLGVTQARAVAPLAGVASPLLVDRSMTRRSSTPPGTSRRRRSTAPPRRTASAPAFTKLGFAFYRLVTISDREPGEPPYAAIRMRVPRAGMAVFAATSPAL